MLENNGVVYQLSSLAKLGDAPVGMRECSLIFKLSEEEKKAGKVKKESLGCFLPLVSQSLYDSFVLSTKGEAAIKGLIEQLQGKLVRKVFLENGRSPSSADFTLEALFEVVESAPSVRLSKELITKWFGDAEVKVAALNFLRGQKAGMSLEQVEGIRQNYLKFFVLLAGKGRIGFPKVEVLEKVALLFGEIAGASMEWNGVEGKLLEALERSYVPTIDSEGL